MSKAILVIDTPKSCEDCSLRFTDDWSDFCPWKGAKSDIFEYVENKRKPDWCPLKPLPEKYDIEEEMEIDK